MRLFAKLAKVVSGSVSIAVILSLVIPNGASAMVANGCGFEVVGHRGTDIGVKNNTKAAFEKAVADGADTIEFDIRRTKATSTSPATWIVNHDSKIGSYVIADTSYAMLKKYQPSLITYREAIAYIATTGRNIQFEIKPKNVSIGSLKSIASVITASNVQGRTYMTSFNVPVLQNWRSINTGIKSAFISSTYVKPATVRTYADAVAFRYDALTAARVKEYKDYTVTKLPIYVYTIDTDSEWATFKAYGVSGIVTDKTATISAWCKS